MSTMSAREIELTKDRARRVEYKRRLEASEASTRLYNQAHAQSQVAPVPAAPVPAAPVLCQHITKVIELDAHPDRTKLQFQVGCKMQVTDAVPEEFAPYIGVVGMIRHMYQIEMGSRYFLAMILSFKSTSPAAEAMMAQVHVNYFSKGRADLLRHITVPSGTLVIAQESYLTPRTMRTSLSRIGDPVTHKRKRAESEEAQESQKARADQDMHSVVDLLLRAAENILALEKETTDKKDSDKADKEDKEDSDDDSEEEVGRLVIDESDDDIDDDKAK